MISATGLLLGLLIGAITIGITHEADSFEKGSATDPYPLCTHVKSLEHVTLQGNGDCPPPTDPLKAKR